MKDLLRDILEEMKDRVILNLETVKDYEKSIKELSSQPETYAHAFNLQMKRRRSRHILNDNLDYLEMQLKIINFIDKYRDNDFLKSELPPVILSDVDYYKETINGNIEFNHRHPFYKNQEFIDMLIKHFLSVEDYVTCEKLSKIKNELNII